MGTGGAGGPTSIGPAGSAGAGGTVTSGQGGAAGAITGGAGTGALGGAGGGARHCLPGGAVFAFLVRSLTTFARGDGGICRSTASISTVARAMAARPRTAAFPTRPRPTVAPGSTTRSAAFGARTSRACSISRTRVAFRRSSFASRASTTSTATTASTSNGRAGSGSARRSIRRALRRRGSCSARTGPPVVSSAHASKPDACARTAMAQSRCAPGTKGPRASAAWTCRSRCRGSPSRQAPSS